MENIFHGILGALSNGQNIAIAGHTNPDGDAIGSSFALALSLRKMGKNPLVLLEDYNEKFEVIPGSEFIYKGDIDQLDVDTFIAVDCSSVERLGKARDLLDKTEESICIGHHASATVFAKYNYLQEGASSASELVFEILNQLVPIDQDIASALYAGVVFDTGGFRHSCTSPKTHNIAAKLMALGIPFVKIYNEIMYTHSFTEAKVFGRALNNLTICEDYPIAYLYITPEDMKETGATAQDLDGIVEYALNIRDISVSILVYAKGEGEVKVSLRSEKVDVGGVACHFGGGGHKLAAGCTFKGTHDEAFSAVLPFIKQALDKDFDENG